MTDRIDLNEIDVDDDEPDEGWLDRTGAGGAATGATDGANGDGTDVNGGDTGNGDSDGTDTDGARDHQPLPGVPRENRDSPVGIPVEGGGAGATPAGTQPTSGEQTPEPGASDSATTGADDQTTEAGGEAVWDGTAEAGTETNGRDSTGRETDGTDSSRSGPDEAAGEGDSIASGPHGGGVDDMTMALTFDAVKRLDDPRFAIIDAKGWTDWIGIVGDVPAYGIKKFQRDHEIDIDFFSGAAQEPAERLADIDEHSMFYAERMVLVGVDGQEAIADRAGWEFVHLETAAEKADWEVGDPA